MPPKVNDLCSKCGTPLQILKKAFYSPKVGYYSGLICSICPYLLINPDDDFIQACIEAEKINDKSHLSSHMLQYPYD